MSKDTKNPRIEDEEEKGTQTPSTSASQDNQTPPPVVPSVPSTPKKEEKKQDKAAGKKKDLTSSPDQSPEVQSLISKLNEELEKVTKLRESLEQKDDEIGKRLSDKEFLTPQRGDQDIQRHQSKAQRMKENLAGQPTVRILVPFEGTEKRGATVPVTLNGFRLNVPKGVYVDVPQQVADVLQQSTMETEEALDTERRLDKADKNTLDALSE